MIQIQHSPHNLDKILVNIEKNIVREKTIQEIQKKRTIFEYGTKN